MAEAATIHMRAPESEIYGRSLSTIYRLGAFMVGKTLSEATGSPEAAQARVEFYTSVEEGFGTDVELGGGLEVRDFDERPVINNKVIAKDLKTPVSEMTAAGLTCAVKTANADRRFLPQLTRSEWDHENAVTVDDMARGKTAYNTRIVISPFPEEAAAQSGDKYWRDIGYVPHLKRGFVQLYHVTDKATVLTGSLSFSGSDKQKLRKIFDQYGVPIPEAESTDNWLKYAITGTCTESEAKALATTIADESGDRKQEKTTNTVDVTRKYGAVMDTVFDESYVHICESLFRGRQTEGLIGLVHQFTDKAHHFNQRYAQALYKMRANTHEFTDDDSAVMHELLVYSTIEMMRALHLDKSASHHEGANPSLTLTHMQSMDPSLFQGMLSGYGGEGARNNRVYSACGLSISLGGNRPDGSPQEAFGGVSSSKQDEESSGKKLMSCPFCKAKVFDDPCAKVLSCWDCRATVVNGRVASKGDGGHKARQAAREQKEQERAELRRSKEAEAQMTQQVDDAFAGIDVATLAEERQRKVQPVAQLALKS